MTDAKLTTPASPAAKPLAVWRWGFSAVLVGIGIWLVVAQPTVVGGNGRVLGWILIGYALVRLLLGYVLNLSRGRTWRR